MSKALHIICGCCGRNDMLSFRIEPKGYCDGDGLEYPAVFVSCGNCGELTGLDEIITENVK